MKRSSESGFRIKIIQEFHLNKLQQKELDNSVKNGCLTYKFIYNHKNDNPIAIKCFYTARKYILGIDRDIMKVVKSLIMFKPIKEENKNG